ncbi:MAG: response regulator [Bacteroidales bacterium]|nr:response regulator [Bacteroidales bacterium]
MRKILSYFLCILCLVAAAVPSVASTQRESYIFKSIGHGDGLLNSVFCIYKTPAKDAWIGTQLGLFRFDGSNLFRYEDDGFNNRSCYQIFVDSEDNFWALIENGLYRFDRDREKFTVCTDNRGSIIDQSVFSYCISENEILFGGRGIIWRYSFSDHSLESYYSLPREYGDFVISSINFYAADKIVCSGQNGALKLGRRSDGSMYLDSRMFSETVSACTVDRKNRLWISRYNKGIDVFDADGTLLKSYNSGNGGINNDIVLCLAERDTLMWAGTDGGGINIINPAGGHNQSFTHIAGDKTSLPANSIRSLHVDHYNNVWAGSVRDGIICIFDSKIITYPDTFPGGDRGLSNPTALHLYQDQDSPYIWIGTDGEGLNRYDQDSKLFRHYGSTYGMKVASIASYSDRYLMLSVFSRGLYLFDRQDGSVRGFSVNDEFLDRQAKNMGRTVNLMNEANGGLLMLGRNMYRWDFRRNEPVELGIVGGGHGNDFFIPVGTSGESSYIHDSHNIYSISDGARDVIQVCSIKDSRINGACVDQNGDIWIACNSGLYHYKARGVLEGPIENTLFQSASAVIRDVKGRVWIGAENRLYAYLADERSFALFGESDGAPANAYIGKSKLLTREGNVYLGGVQGMLRIDRDYIIDRSERPIMHLTCFSVDGNNYQPGENFEAKIPMGAKAIEINVASEEKDFFRQKRYRYSIDLDESMTYESFSSEFSLRPMPPAGRHELYISCTTRSGEWTPQRKVATFHIPQLWYKSRWFYALCVLFLLLISFSITYFLLMQQKQKSLVALKEQERSAFENKVSILTSWGNELKTPLTLVLAPLKNILQNMDPSDRNYTQLRRIYRHSKRMRDSVNVMLDLKKMEEGKADLNLQSQSLNQWLELVVEDHIYEAQLHNVKISTALDPHIQELVFDPRKCDMALSTFIQHTLKASSNNDIILVSTALTDHGTARISVSGQSINMLADTADGDNGIAIRYAGIIAQLHSGKSGWFNNDRDGQTFWFELPLKLNLEDIKVEERAYMTEILGNEQQEFDDNSLVSKSFDTTKTKLLLIDDSQDLLDFIKTALAYNFASISTASNEEDAILQTKEQMPDIIVCDVNMPGGTGYDFCSRIKKSEKYGHIPVILMTVKSEEQSAQYGYGVGAEAILDKPFEMETLYELICNILRRKSDIKKRYMDNQADDLDYKSAEEQFIISVNKIISENISNPELGVTTLCTNIGISRAVLYNKMKAVTGVGANEYICKIRMDKAIFLIENTDLTFAEIADRTGYASPSYFSTAFKQYTGMTPSQYKNGKNKN